jgi:hypothetical protein
MLHRRSQHGHACQPGTARRLQVDNPSSHSSTGASNRWQPGSPLTGLQSTPLRRQPQTLTHDHKPPNKSSFGCLLLLLGCVQLSKRGVTFHAVLAHVSGPHNYGGGHHNL